MRAVVNFVAERASPFNRFWTHWETFTLNPKDFLEAFWVEHLVPNPIPRLIEIYGNSVAKNKIHNTSVGPRLLDSMEYDGNYVHLQPQNRLHRCIRQRLFDGMHVFFVPISLQRFSKFPLSQPGVRNQ
jgi:hypothetical protein